jgi:hypothetical protein
MPKPPTFSTSPQGHREGRGIGITQNSVGVADQAEPGDQFGRAVGNALGGG